MKRQPGLATSHILLICVVILGVTGCRSAIARTYTFNGDVVLTNECSGNAADVSPRVRMIVQLHFKDQTIPWRSDKTFNAQVTGPATRSAAFSFSTTANGEPEFWEIVSVFDGNRTLHPCELIDCPTDGPLSCRDIAQHVRRIAVVGAVTTHQERINCSCIE